MNHTVECLARQESYKAELTAYEAKWPKYCRSCGGEGGTYWSGNFEPCMHCMFVGLCPRCGEHTWGEDSDFEPCAFCRWNCENPDMIPQPDDISCECELVEIYATANDSERDIIHAAWLYGGDEPWSRT